MLALLCMAAPMQAQVYKDTKSSPKKRLNTLLGDLKRGMQKTGESLSGLLGLGETTDTTLIEIDGMEYMPVHTVNLFHADSVAMYAACRRDFARRYEHATIVSVVIPQADWRETAISENKKIKMYKRKAYCYVLAKDGADGYINARYAFVQLRKPGKRWLAPEGYWPRFERADAIPTVHYQKLVRQHAR